MNIITVTICGIDYFRGFDGLWFYREDGYICRKFKPKEQEAAYKSYVDQQQNKADIGVSNEG